MPFQTPDPPLRRHLRLNGAKMRARVPVAFIDCSHIAWDGHDLVVISKFDVILD